MFFSQLVTNVTTIYNAMGIVILKSGGSSCMCRHSMHADAYVCEETKLTCCYFLQKAIQASNALTYGLKDKRRYRWYSVWDIWRRLLFVAVNVFLGFTTRSVVLVCDVRVV